MENNGIDILKIESYFDINLQIDLEKINLIQTVKKRIKEFIIVLSS